MARMPSKRWDAEIQKVQRHDDWGISVISTDDVVNILSRQHASVVRLVKKLDEMEFKNMSADFQAGQHNAYMRVLAALQQEGRKNVLRGM